MIETDVLTILRTVTGSCDFGYVKNYPGETEDEQRTNFWIDVIRVKSADSGFGHLVDSIIEEGFHGSAIGWDEFDEGGYISEGHHRLVAAILLGLDRVFTSPYGKSGDHKPREGMNGYFSAHMSCRVDMAIEVDI